jgi:hypothetical protein
VDLQDRERPARATGGERLVPARHRHDTGQPVLARAREPRGHAGAVRHADRRHAALVEATVRQEPVEHGVEELDVGAVLGGRDAPPWAPGVGVHDGEALALGQPREAGVALHESAVGLRAVKREHEGHATTARPRDVNEGGPRALALDRNRDADGPARPPGAHARRIDGPRRRWRARPGSAATADARECEREQRGEQRDREQQPADAHRAAQPSGRA